MADSFNSGEDQDINIEINYSVQDILATVERDPALLAMIERVTRSQNLRLARRVGNTSGKYAQRHIPQGVVNQNPSTKRIF